MRRRQLQFRALLGDELVVDNFAGGGGASTGIEAALGRPPDIAINHDPEAIVMHRVNHPETKHFCENIWEVDPRVACGSRPVGLAWFSPACNHFSRAKGATPLKNEIRGLAWVVIRWAETVAPKVIMLENVEEFQTWGPLGDDGRPDAARSGETFREWLGKLTDLGYSVEFRSLVAADYGVPTTRKRLYLIARLDGHRAAWPKATHAPTRWRPAAEIIDWTLPVPSIFDRASPLREATLRRIAAGVRRYVIEAAEPFIIPVTHRGDARVNGIGEPLRTITAAHRGELALVAPSFVGAGTAQDHHALSAAFLTKFYGTSVGSDVRCPMPTITSGGGRGGGHIAEVRAFLTSYYGQGVGSRMTDPLRTVTAKDRFGLVTVRNVDYVITDIGMRMLQPPELYAAQGFPDDYEIAPDYHGKPLTKTAQTRLAGNSVCPPVAKAIVAENMRR